MDLRYPIGQYEPKSFSDDQKLTWLQNIQSLPDLIESAVRNLDEQQLCTPYRDGGWTIKEVVHHVADTHMNAYIRFKLGLTENNPTIKPYDEALWAQLADVSHVSVDISIKLLHALHTRWYAALHNMPDEAWMRTVFHPEAKKEITLWDLLGTYSWHGLHHLAHITTLKQRKGW